MSGGEGEGEGERGVSALCKLGGGSLSQDGIPVWWFLNRNLFLLLCRGGWLVADSWASFLHQTTLNSSSTVLYSTALEYKAFISERPDSLFRSRSWWFCVGLMCLRGGAVNMRSVAGNPCGDGSSILRATTPTTTTQAVHPCGIL